MKDRNEFWHKQPDLLFATIQAANKAAYVFDPSPAILWHYTVTQPDLSKAVVKKKQYSSFFIISGVIILLLSIGAYIVFKVLGFDFETIIMTIRARLWAYLALMMLSVPIIAIISFIYAVINSQIAWVKQKKIEKDAFTPKKNTTYLLTSDGFYMYLPNRDNYALAFRRKIFISDISVVKTNPTTVEIYTNKIKPIILDIPATEAEALKQHLLRLSTDILDANK
jgi:hypothetical protein